MNADKEFLNREKEQIKKTLSMIEELLSRDQLSCFEVISLGTLLHNVYTGIEHILRFKLEKRGHKIEKKATWHKDLLLKARDEELLNDSQFEGFGKLLAFRHLYIHGYSHTLDEKRVIELANPIPQLLYEFIKEII